MKSIAFVCLAVLTALTISGCVNRQDDNPPDENHTEIIITKAQFNHEKMETGKPELIELEERVYSRGMIKPLPENFITVSAYFSGIVRGLKLSPGQYVKKGELLLQMESTEILELQKEFIESEAKLPLLRKNFENLKVLNEQGVVSENEFLLARNELLSAEARNASLKALFRMAGIDPTTIEPQRISPTISVRSPLSGYIARVNCHNGLHVSTGQPLLELFNKDLLQLELQIFLDDIDKIKEGQPVRFFSSVWPGKIFEARIVSVGNYLQSETTTVISKAIIDTENSQELISGVPVEAEIIVGTKKAYCLPEESVYQSDYFSWVLELQHEDDSNYYFRKVPVKMGKKYSSCLEIIEGINPEMTLLLKGGYNLIIR